MSFSSYAGGNQFTKLNQDGTIDKRRYETKLYPNIKPQSDDIYITTKVNDRLDIIANEYYGNPIYWKVLAVANKLGRGTLVIPEGTELRIPQDLNFIERLYVNYNNNI